jgi:hypothetical protein
MKTTTLALIASFGLIGAPAMAESSWTWNGPNGGTSAGTTNCSYANGITDCQSKSTYTNPYGKVFQRESAGTGNRFGGQRNVTTVGPNGNAATKTFNWQRN